MSLVQHSLGCTGVVCPVHKLQYPLNVWTEIQFSSRHRGLERGYERSLEQELPPCDCPTSTMLAALLKIDVF